jgi:abortive infection bacteriophage resistance protein
MVETLSPSPSALGKGWLSFNLMGLILILKLHRSYQEQLDILTSRGMQIANPQAARQDLANIGYYRLAAYWYQFRVIEKPDDAGEVSRSEEFHAGASFAQARDLWQFDRRLRLLLLEAVERIEVALRVRISHRLGEDSPFGHLDSAFLDTERCLIEDSHPLTTGTAHEAWIAKYEEKLTTTDDDILRLYREKWGLKPPVWVAVELLDFGMLSKFFRLMTKVQQSDVARTFDISQGSFLVNWAKVLNHVRNMCAHHSRVWNQPITYRLQRIPVKLSPLLAPLHEITGTSTTRIYSVLHLCAFLLQSLGEGADWTKRTSSLLQAFPLAPGVSMENMGVPTGWQDFEIWNPAISTSLRTENS